MTWRFVCLIEPAWRRVWKMPSTISGFFQGTEMPTAGWWEALWPDPAGVLAALGVRPGMEVVDLCSGDGWFTLQIAKIAHHVIAIDIDPNLLAVARHRLTESGVANCDFVPGDAYELAKLVPGCADFIFLANAFHGVPDRPRLAQAVRATLKPGGRFAIVNWHQRPREETRILGATRAKNRIEIVAATDHYRRRSRRPEARLGDRNSPITTARFSSGRQLTRNNAFDSRPKRYDCAVGFLACGSAARGAPAKRACDRRRPACLHLRPGWGHCSSIEANGAVETVSGLGLLPHRTRHLHAS